ncbi:hypothetical protein MKX36_12155 [Paenibacillus sp. FSL W8-0439]|uniref:hypothetical protein n=1 Tax=Paenibacillus TaxID=44249 RepID=UPI0011AB4875|nr:hypothetical protein [Paenibacillus polymyxa]
MMMNTFNNVHDKEIYFIITETMTGKINEWDMCVPIDVTGAKFSYTFIPTGIGIIIQVHCDVCDRILDLTEGLFC